MRKVCNGRISSGFGLRVDPITKQPGSGHNGIDVACPVGTPILSPCNGWVVEVRQNATEGIAVIVRDEEREMRFGFCHLSKATLAVGSTIAKGDIIALSGNTGRSTGAHLHFTAKDGGKWNANQYIGGSFVDPTHYLNII